MYASYQAWLIANDSELKHAKKVRALLGALARTRELDGLMPCPAWEEVGTCPRGTGPRLLRLAGQRHTRRASPAPSCRS